MKKEFAEILQKDVWILENHKSLYLRAIFDSTNFAQIKVDLLKEALSLLFPFILDIYNYIKDTLFDIRKIVSRFRHL